MKLLELYASLFEDKVSPFQAFAEKDYESIPDDLQVFIGQLRRLFNADLPSGASKTTKGDYLPVDADTFARAFPEHEREIAKLTTGMMGASAFGPQLNMSKDPYVIIFRSGAAIWTADPDRSDPKFMAVYDARRKEWRQIERVDVPSLISKGLFRDSYNVVPPNKIKSYQSDVSQYRAKRRTKDKPVEPEPSMPPDEEEDDDDWDEEDEWDDDRPMDLDLFDDL